MVKYLKDDRGATLLELLLAMSITGMVLILSYSLYSSAVKTTNFGTEQIKNEQDMRLLDNIFRRKIRNTTYLRLKNESEEEIKIGESEEENVSQIKIGDIITYNDRKVIYNNLSDIKIQILKVDPDKLILIFKVFGVSQNTGSNFEKKILLNNLREKDIVINDFQTKQNQDTIIFEGSLAELNYKDKEGV